MYVMYVEKFLHELKGHKWASQSDNEDSVVTCIATNTWMAHVPLTCLKPLATAAQKSTSREASDDDNTSHGSPCPGHLPNVTLFIEANFHAKLSSFSR